MNRLYSLLVLLFAAIAANAQTPAKDAKPGQAMAAPTATGQATALQATPGQPTAAPTAPAPKPTASGYRIKYDHKALRIPGNKFAIGLIVPPDGKSAADTIGYPGKHSAWGKYHIEIDSGSFSSGKVKLHASESYKKHDSVTVTVYTRKWFLGGRGKLLVSRKIPYDYEDGIVLLTSGNAGRAPGDHVKFGLRTLYDDKQFSELWYPVKKKDKGRFQFGFDGGHLSTKKGDWKINSDPTRIKGDRIRLFAQLAKDTAITDTLSLMLDYTANYRCTILSAGDGHELDATVDVYDDSIIDAQLLRLDIRDSATHRTYHYLLNTKGSQIAITSMGAGGANGSDGMSGIDGTTGADGSTYLVPVTTTNPDGTTTTTYVDAQGPGGDGGNGGPGDDGQDGGVGGDGGSVFIRFTAAAKPFLGMIHASSIAGSGGYGGQGGAGGRGGQGGSGAPPGQSGHKGLDGSNGANGRPGRPRAVQFLPL